MEITQAQVIPDAERLSTVEALTTFKLLSERMTPIKLQ